MRKLCLLLAASLMLGVVANAQYHYLKHFYSPGENPGGLNVDDENPNPGTNGWTSLYLGGGGTTPVWSNGTIPFSFQFNGSFFSSFWVSNTGVVTFQPSPGTAPNTFSVSLPSAALPNNSITVWGLAGFGTNDNILAKTFGTAPNRQHWIWFNSFSDPLFTTNCFSYWAIVLEEGTNKVYIVDQRTNACVQSVITGLQYNSSSALEVPWPLGTSFGGVSSGVEDNQYVEFIPGAAPGLDVAGLQPNNVPTVLALGQSANISTRMGNYGSNAFNSATYNYQVNGGSVVSTTISGLTSLTGQGETFSFTHPTPWTPFGSGNFTIKAWMANFQGAGGATDLNPSNDTVTMNIFVGGASVTRTVLHENFSSSTTPPAATANPYLRDVLDSLTFPYTFIYYPMFWPGSGDPYHTTDAETRRNFYGLNAVPNVWVDGDFSGQPLTYNTGIANNIANDPCFMTLSASHSVTGSTVNVNMDIDVTSPYNSNNLTAYIAVVENSTTGNVATNGETIFYFTMHKMLPDGNGISINSLTPGTTVSLNQSYTFPTGSNVEDFDSLSVVVFVQDDLTQEVHQSAWSNVISQLQLSTTVVDAGCPGSSAGSVDLTVSGGVAPFTYLWSNGSTTEDLSGVPSGTYTVTVTEGGGGTATTTAFVSELPVIQATINTTDANCGSTDGAALVTVNPGSGPYTYSWSNGSTSSAINNLSAGVFTLTITDANGCTSVGQAAISTIGGPSITVISTDPTCAGYTDGNALVSANGGSQPYTYQWSNGGSTSAITNLAGGNYSITVTDNAGCDAIAIANLIDPAGTVASTASIAASCGLNDGGATVTVLNGSGPYTYNWNDPGNSTGTTVNNLAAGSYQVTITDGQGCTVVQSANVSNANAPVVTATGLNVTCVGGADGVASVTATGGTAPYTYLWNDPGNSTSSIVNTLPVGSYTVTVTDGAGCLSIQSVTLMATNPQPVVSLGPDINLPAGSSTTLNPGAGFASYLWSNGTTGTTLLVDSTGTYSVTITDANGCSNSDTIMVSIGVGLDELLSQQAVQTYPNPSMGDLVVEIDAAIRGSFQLTVIDQQGRVVRQQPLQLNGRNTRHSLDLNKEAAGIYFLKLQGEDYSWVRRIALQ